MTTSAREHALRIWEGVFQVNQCCGDAYSRDLVAGKIMQAIEAAVQAEREANAAMLEGLRQMNNRWWIERIIECHGEGERQYVENDPLMALYGLCDTPFKQELQAELLRSRKP